MFNVTSFLGRFSAVIRDQALMVGMSLVAITVIALFVSSSPIQAQSKDCVRIRDGVYASLSNNTVLIGSVTGYSDSQCTVERGIVRPYSGAWVYTRGGVQLATAACRIAFGEGAWARPEPWTASNFYRCVRAASNANPPSDSGAAVSEDRNPVRRGGISVVAGGETSSRRLASSAPSATPDLSEILASARDGMGSGIKFQRLSPAGVGIQSVLDMGFLDAVDVWSNIGNGYEVCFPQIGRVVFLDAATAPRTVTEIDQSVRGAWTCAVSSRAGSLILVQAAQPPQSAGDAPRRPDTDDDVDAAIDLDNCEVTPRFNLRLRQSPWGEQLGIAPSDLAVAVLGRTESWFKVVSEGVTGWIAAWLTSSAGDCDWIEESEPQLEDGASGDGASEPDS